MAIKIEALISGFLQTGGQALYLVPGEPIYMIRDGQRVQVGRDALGLGVFKAAAARIAPGDATELARCRHKTVFEPPHLAPTEVCFHLRGARPALMFRRLGGSAPDPATAERAGEDARRPRPASGELSAVGVAPAARQRGDSTRAENPDPTPDAEAGADEPAPPQPELDLELPPDDGTPFEIEQNCPLEVSAAPEPLGPNELPTEAVEGLSWLDRVLRRAADLCASDVRLMVGSRPVARMGARLQAMFEYSEIEAGDLAACLENVMPPARFEQLGREGWARCVVESGADRYVLQAFRDRAGLGACLRRQFPKVPSPGELGLPAVLTELVGRRRGLLLIAGASRSGKSSTLAALVGLLNADRPATIVTVEETCEFFARSRTCW
jgi:hypothetical protein